MGWQELDPVPPPLPPQAAVQDNAGKGSISLAPERAGIGHLPECLRLARLAASCPGRNAEALRPFDSPDAGGEISGRLRECFADLHMSA